MFKTIFYSLKLLTLILLFICNLHADELTIIPIKKPILDKITKQEKLAQGIIRPKSKPINKVKNKLVMQEIINPVPKPIKKNKN